MIQPGLLAAIDFTATVFWVLRLAASVGGALVGWFAAGPAMRALYRVARRRAAPRSLVSLARLGGSALIAWLVFQFLPVGGGSGFGWGKGAGGGPGHGPGDGSSAHAVDSSHDTAAPAKKDLETLEIELVGGKRYQGQDRFYLLNRKEPAVTLKDVEDYLVKNNERLAQDVMIIFTPESVAQGHGAVLRLNGVIEKHKRTPQVKNVTAATRT